MCKTIFKYMLLLFPVFVQQKAGAKSFVYTSTKEENVTFKIIPGEKDAVFRKTKPKYTVKIESTYKEKQTGTFTYILTNEKHQFIAKGTADLKVAKMGSVTLPVELPVTDPGFYEFTAMISLDYYEDTVRNVCGYQPELINTPFHKPADFDAFWDRTKTELAKVPPNYVVTRSNEKSDYAHDVYLVEMQSLDTVKIYGWLTVPKLKKNYPVLLALPGYRVELKPQLPDEFAIFALNIRGIHPSTERIDPKNTEYNLYNIQDKNKYIYRGAYMDCVRAMDFIFSHEYLGLDISRVSVGGGSQGGALAIALCGLDNRVACCVADNPIYCDLHTTYEINTKGPSVAWPFSRFMEYVKYKPNMHIDNILSVLDYFDPQNFSPNVRCPVLVGIGALDHLAPPTTVYAMYNKMSSKVKSESEVYVFPDKAHEVNLHHGKFRNVWMLEKLVTRHPYAK